MWHLNRRENEPSVEDIARFFQHKSVGEVVRFLVCYSEKKCYLAFVVNISIRNLFRSPLFHGPPPQGTSWQPVWSQSMIREWGTENSRMSFSNFSTNSLLVLSKSLGKFLTVFLPLRLTKPIRRKIDLAKCFVISMWLPNLANSSIKPGNDDLRPRHDDP